MNLRDVITRQNSQFVAVRRDELRAQTPRKREATAIGERNALPIGFELRGVFHEIRIHVFAANQTVTPE